MGQFAMKQLKSPLAQVLVSACVAFGSAAAAEPAIQVTGKGVQIYACNAAGGAYAWQLKGPEAALLGDGGKVIGRHFAGPSWQAQDGSTIVGEPLVSSPSPVSGSVPWLVLRVKSASGTGLFSNVGYVTRTMTQGGAPPAAMCDLAHAGLEVRSPYSATYTFFPTPAAAAH
jgi:hypothetical protein